MLKLTLRAQVSRRAVGPPVSVTIPYRDYGQYLLQCVNSALDQLRFKLSQLTIQTRKER